MQEIFVDRRRALAFWPALIAVQIAEPFDPHVPVIEYRAQAFEKWWKAEAVAFQSQGTYACLELRFLRLTNINSDTVEGRNSDEVC